MKKVRKYRNGTNANGVVRNYIETPYESLYKNQLAMEAADYNVGSNPFIQGLDLLGSMGLQYGLQGINNSLMPEQKAFGGKVGNVPVNVEGQEVAETPQGDLMEFQGASHEGGGIDANLPEGTEIFSKKIKVHGVSMAERKKKREKKEMDLVKLIDIDENDFINKKTLERVRENNKKQEQADLQVQDSIDNILSPKKNNGNRKEYRTGGRVRRYGGGGGDNKKPIPSDSLKNQKTNVSDYLNFNAVNPNDSQLVPYNSQYTPLDVQLAPYYDFTPIKPLEKPLQSDSLKNNNTLQADSLNLPAVDNVDSLLNIRPTYADYNAKKNDLQNYFNEDLKYMNFNDNDLIPYNISNSNISKTDKNSVALNSGANKTVIDNSVIDPIINKTKGVIPSINKTKEITTTPINEQNDFIDYSLFNKKENSLAPNLPDYMEDLSLDYRYPSGFQSNETTSTTKGLEIDNINIGNYASMLGNLYSMYKPIQNTREMRAGDMPNINYYKDFGQDALESLDRSQGYLTGQRSDAFNDLNIERNMALNRGRNTARGVNTMRALDLASTAQNNQAKRKIYNTFNNAFMQLEGQRGRLENTRDQAVMTGEEKRDMANRADRDNYYTQMAKNYATIGEGMQEIGMDLNSTQLSKLQKEIIDGMVKDGINIFKAKNFTGKRSTSKKK